MTIYEFKREVCALLNRSEQSLVVNGIDLVINAANRGKSTAQRMLDFERLRRSVDVVVSLQNGIELGAAVLTGTTTQVEINRIRRGYMQFDGGGILPIEFVNKDSYLARLQRRLSYDPQLRYPQDASRVSMPEQPVMYKQDNTLYLWPPGSNLFNNVTTVKLGLDVVIRDKEWTSAQAIYMRAYSNFGPIDTSALGPYNAPAASNPALAPAMLNEVGILNGQPMFTSNGMWLNYTLNFPDDNIPGVVSQGRWILSDSPENVGYCWASPPGVSSLNEATYWTPVGFGVTSNVVFGTTTGQTLLQNNSVADFWLDECQEWLQLYVIQYLQSHFIKDKTGWPVTQQMVEKAWQSISSWNDSISESEPDYDLD